MGVSKIVTVSCDYSGCKSVLSWNETDVSAGRKSPPEESQYLVLLTINNVNKSFCCQLHAAEYFLPPGYEAKQKQVIEFPKKPVEEEVLPRWQRRQKDDRIVLSEPESVSQPDGYSDPGGTQLDAE